ncbi:MAG: type I secretion system permease/ATPase [Sulfitobacter sp.]
MRVSDAKQGKDELRDARVRSRPLYWAVGLFSMFANLLMLTGPLYMLQVYDRVLASGSGATLIALSLLMVFLYATMGVLDFTRGRIMVRVALRFHQDLKKRVFHAVMRKSAVLPDVRTRAGLQDLENVQRLIASPVVISGFDLPWTPIFFTAIFVFHPMLGALALGGGVALVLITLANQMLSRRSQAMAGSQQQNAQSTAAQIGMQAEAVRAMGMQEAAYQRWAGTQAEAAQADLTRSNIGRGFSTLTKTLRLFLQSAMLGLGAWLVIGGQMTPGGMIAGSVLLGRALSPVESLLNQWPVAQQGMRSWGHLAMLLDEVPGDAPRVALPKPKSLLEVNAITVVPPGERFAALKALSFKVEPGQAVGIIGPSGSGKSTLARALVGIWPPAGGQLRLDGASLDHYAPEALGQYVGYLPQQVGLFDGTLAQNIARLAPTPDEAQVIAAAKMAGAHDMILSLPQGYDTKITEGRHRLSGGQLQRIGLARALYADPAVLVLDEPNANLDNVGSEALNAAVQRFKALGRAVLIMAHRPAAIRECEMLLVLDGGTRTAFGAKDEVLSGMVKNGRALKAVPSATAGAG